MKTFATSMLGKSQLNTNMLHRWVLSYIGLVFEHITLTHTTHKEGNYVRPVCSIHTLKMEKHSETEMNFVLLQGVKPLEFIRAKGKASRNEDRQAH